MEEIEYISEDDFNKSVVIISEAYDSGNIDINVLEKAKKDISKLQKKTITDKNGQKKVVYVKIGEEESKDKQPKQEENGQDKETQDRGKHLHEHAQEASDEDLKRVMNDKDADPKLKEVAHEELVSRASNDDKYLFTEKDQQMVYDYTGAGYFINHRLRSGKIDEADKKYVNDLNTALDKLPNFSGEVYRAISVDNLSDYFNDFKNIKGSTIQYDAFTSTTKDKNVLKSFPQDVLFTIKSKSGKGIEEWSDVKKEQEVLFKAGSQFKVSKVKMVKGQCHIELAEV